MSQEERLYGTMAKYYDEIYHWKDYGKESLKIRKLITRYKRSTGRSLLDIACGTGKHVQHLQTISIA
jgi:ubiquinone/menaquinone biosynthesis C-methylase UbiE